MRRRRQDKIEDFVRELISDFRWSQFFAICCLMILSGLFVYSAKYRSPDTIPDEFKKQCLWFGLGLVGYFLTALIDYHWLSRKSWIFYLGSVLLLIWVLKFGKTINGAKSWIGVAGVMIQPSEFAKLTMLLALCYYLSLCEGVLSEWRHLVFATGIGMLPFGLILVQPDVGTVLVIVSLFFALLFLGGAPMRLFTILGLVGFLGAGMVIFETYRYSKIQDHNVVAAAAHATAVSQSWSKSHARNTATNTVAPIKFKSFLHLKKHHFDRFIGIVAPEKLNPLKEGWNAEQSKIAIGSGGFSGKGWTKGDVTHGDYLPQSVAHSDFIFSVFAEETGFVGGLVLVTLYAILLLGGMRIAMRAGDPLGTLLASGVVLMIFFHVFINMGMTLGILPIIGVPLPLMSYGGSFVLVCMVALGLLQSVWLHRKPY